MRQWVRAYPLVLLLLLLLLLVCMQHMQQKFRVLPLLLLQQVPWVAARWLPWVRQQ
jgi:hypothetical protein